MKNSTSLRPSNPTPRHIPSCYCSVTKSRLILCNSMNCSTLGFLVLHYLPEFAQTHVHWVRDAIILSSVTPFSSALTLSQHQVFSKESALCIRWAKYWSFSVSPSSEYSGLISFRIDLFHLLAESSPAPQFESINSLALSFLYDPTLISRCDYWKNRSLIRR